MRRKRGADGSDAEVEQLRLRLEEAEQTLAAIRSGTVDALVVSGPDGDRVLELDRADPTQMLARAGASLGGSFDLSSLLQNFVSSLVPSLACVCVVHALGDDRNTLEIGALACAEEGLVETLRPALEGAGQARAPSFLDAALQTTSGRYFHRLPEGDPYSSAYAVARVASFILAPVRAHRRKLGVLVVARRGNRAPLGNDDLWLVEELAVRLGVAIDSAKLFALAQREKARVEEANRAKDDFLAAVSHELRTPLNAILGWARILRAHELPESKRERAIETIERNASIQAQLIDDLLDISRIVSGKLRVEQREIDAGLVVAAAIDSVRPTAQAKNVALEAAIDPAAGVVLGDAERLQQVVWNLLTNAVKFTAAGGHVVATLRRSSAHVEIEVADDGRGISREFLPHVFERFRQGDGASTRTYGGLGIGLTIAKNLVDLHGGTIEAYSDGEHCGSRFVVRLPRAPVKGDARPTPVGPAVDRTDLTGAHLLVVDDDADGRELMAELLRDCKAEVSTADSAVSAFDVIQRERFDALLSDIGMPGEDGYSLITRVRTLPPEKNGRVPAVAITAFARNEDRRRALLAGFDGHVPKPVEPRELMLVLSNMLRRG